MHTLHYTDAARRWQHHGRQCSLYSATRKHWIAIHTAHKYGPHLSVYQIHLRYMAAVVSFWFRETTSYKERLTTKSGFTWWNKFTLVFFVGTILYSLAQCLPVIIFGVGELTNWAVDTLCVARCVKWKLIQVKMESMSSWRGRQTFIVLMCSLHIAETTVPEGTLYSTCKFLSLIFLLFLSLLSRFRFVVDYNIFHTNKIVILWCLWRVC